MRNNPYDPPKVETQLPQPAPPPKAKSLDKYLWVAVAVVATQIILQIILWNIWNLLT